MSELSEVSILFGQHVSDIERARDIFTAETRRFVGDLLDALGHDRSGPWSAPKVQVKTKDADLEKEEKITGFLSRQYALASLPLCFKIKVKYVAIAEINFGVEFDSPTGSFAWRVRLVPASRYQWLDELVWTEWQKLKPTLPPGAKHEAKEGAVVFVSRRFGPDLTFKLALEDIGDVLRFALAAEPVLVSEFAKQLVDEPVSE
jgi:hypothetical protein